MVQNLDSVLQRHNITMQQYHGRSFTGNSCHKYLKEDVYEDICNSMVEETTRMSNSDQNIVIDAETIADRFEKLNRKFAEAHKLVSHTNGLTARESNFIQDKVNSYFTEYYAQYPNSVYPKLHILKEHVVSWIKSHGFGLNLLGEQGIESSHKSINRLKRMCSGVPKETRSLEMIMKRHLAMSHPENTNHMIPSSKRKLKMKKESSC